MLVSLPLLGFAQSLTLDECQKMAHDNYPAIKQYGMVETLRDYNVSNATKGWLPQVNVQAGAYAFTDIINANQQMEQMGFDMKNYMASGMVSVKQTIYDGGTDCCWQGGGEGASGGAETTNRCFDARHQRASGATLLRCADPR